MDKPWKVILAFVGVFIAGSVFGGFFALRIGHQIAQRAGKRVLPSQSPILPPAVQLLRRFADRLELTVTQREKIAPIVSRGEEELSRARQSSLEQTGGILRRAQQEFRAELTPDQRRKLDRMEQSQRELMRQERMKRGVPPQSFGPQGPAPDGPGRPFNPNQRPFKQGPRPGPNAPFSNQPGPNGPGPNLPPNQLFPNQGQLPPPSPNGPVGPPEAPPGNPPVRGEN
ncbi:MAG: hypothetical protein EXS38_08815 [Opitutus sp.]|nr:hypothetical protein [Opitutus sp.]